MAVHHRPVARSSPPAAAQKSTDSPRLFMAFAAPGRFQPTRGFRRWHHHAANTPPMDDRRR
jgi:hypothetical protein